MTRRRSERGAAGSLLALLLVIGCGDPPPPPPRAEPEVLPRAILNLGQPLYQIGGTATDTLLLSPRLLQMGDSMFYLFDYGDSRLKAFSNDTGELRWALGGEDSPQAIFGNPTQIAVRAGSSELWVLDGANRNVRIVVDSSIGGSFALPAEPALVDRVLRLDDYEIATFTTGDAFFAPLDSSLAPVSPQPFPTPGLGGADAGLRRVHVAVDGAGQRWAAGFAFTRDFAIYADTTVRCVGRVREGPAIEMAAAAATPRSWIGGVAFSEDHLLVLARSTERNRIDTIDMFREDCAYIGSVQLPGVARAFSANGRRMLVELEDPLPRIVMYPVPDSE